MQTTKENQDSVQPIAPESSNELSAQLQKLDALLRNGSDEQITTCIGSFHHSDLADAVGLITGNLRKRLLGFLKSELDPDLLFELEDHLRKEVTDTLSPKEVANVITEMDTDEAEQVLEDMEENERVEILSEVPVDEREDIEVGLAYPCLLYTSDAADE